MYHICSMRSIVIVLLTLVTYWGKATDSLLIPKLLQNIVNKQVLSTDFFVEGSFPGFRQHNNDEALKADNNIFYTTLIAYTLQDLKPYLTKEEAIVADTVIQRSKRAFPHYQNAKGRLSYNFWQTKNGGDFFPNERWLNSLKNKLALPDDLDDTGMILSVLNIDSTTAAKAHLLMQQFANGKYTTIKNTYKNFRNVPAYSTWYGVKMPVDFDFGVHCNILSFINKYHLPWSYSDSATYNLLLAMIDDKLFLRQPEYISPYYGYAPVLLYHLARLMSVKYMPELESRKQELIKDAADLLHSTDNILYKTLLATCLLKWNAITPEINLPVGIENGIANTTDFVYYTGHLFGHLNNNSIKKIAGKLNITQYKWYCAAYNDCLVLEYLILKYRRDKTHGN